MTYSVGNWATQGLPMLAEAVSKGPLARYPFRESAAPVALVAGLSPSQYAGARLSGAAVFF